MRSALALLLALLPPAQAANLASRGTSVPSVKLAGPISTPVQPQLGVLPPIPALTPTMVPVPNVGVVPNAAPAAPAAAALPSPVAALPQIQAMAAQAGGDSSGNVPSTLGAAFDGGAPAPAPQEPEPPTPPKKKASRLVAAATGLAISWRTLRYGGVDRLVDELLDARLTPQQRLTAARRLGARGKRETIEALAAAAQADADAGVRAAAQDSLARVFALSEDAVVREAALHPLAGRRTSALRALGAVARLFDAPAALERLSVSAALDFDADVRLFAIHELSQARSPKAVTALHRLKYGADEPEIVSALEVAIAAAEARQHAAGLAPAAYRPPEGDFESSAKKPLHQGALKKVIAVSAFFTAIELIGSAATGSVSLKADAMHLAADLAINAGALAAMWAARRPPNSRKTYGYLKLESVVGLGSALAIAGMGLFTGVEAIHRLLHPEAVPALETMLLAFSGLASNAISTWLLWRHRDASLGLKGAFIHAATDAVGSLGIILGSALILTLGWLWADPVISLGIVGLIFHTTWDLAKRSWNVLIDAVPPGTDLQAIERALLAIPGVVSVYDLHAWSLNSAERSATVALYVKADADRDAVLAAAKKALTDAGLAHSTVELRTLPH